jgi:cytochrome c oxidase cbb3-type subunit 2
MPAFKHLFDYDPRGTGERISSIPNYKFEALFQYLMTKGTRITSPTEAWWLGKDPVMTVDIIEGRTKK